MTQGYRNSFLQAVVVAYSVFFSLFSGASSAVTSLGQIVGSVTDATDASVIPSAEVYVYNGDGTYYETAVVDSSGEYVLDVPAGNYYLHTHNGANYLDKIHDGSLCGQQCYQDAFRDGKWAATSSLTPVKVFAEEISKADFSLVKGGIISGHVFDAEEQPIQGINITLYDLTDGQQVESFSSGEDGYYSSKSGLLDGNYRVQTASWPGHIQACYGPEPCTLGESIEIVQANTQSDIDIQLRESAVINVSVASADGEPTAPEYVRVYIYSEASNAPVKSEKIMLGRPFPFNMNLDSGRYFIHTSNVDGFFDEVYMSEVNVHCEGPCRPKSGDALDIQAGETKNINFILERAGWISGVIKDANGVALNSQIAWLFNQDNEIVSYGVTNVNGEYRSAGGVSSGNYILRTDNSLGLIDEYHTGKPVAGTEVVLPIEIIVDTVYGDHQVIVFSLDPGALISGQVVAAGTKSVLDKVDIEVFDQNGVWATSGRTNETGHYTTQGSVPEGRYYIVATKKDYAGELYGDVLFDPAVHCANKSPCQLEMSAVTATEAELINVVDINYDVNNADFELSPLDDDNPELENEISPPSVQELPPEFYGTGAFGYEFFFIVLIGLLWQRQYGKL